MFALPAYFLSTHCVPNGVFSVRAFATAARICRKLSSPQQRNIHLTIIPPPMTASPTLSMFLNNIAMHMPWRICLIYIIKYSIGHGTSEISVFYQTHGRALLSQSPHSLYIYVHIIMSWRFHTVVMYHLFLVHPEY